MAYRPGYNNKNTEESQQQCSMAYRRAIIRKIRKNRNSNIARPIGRAIIIKIIRNNRNDNIARPIGQAIIKIRKNRNSNIARPIGRAIIIQGNWECQHMFQMECIMFIECSCRTLNKPSNPDRLCSHYDSRLLV